MLLHTRRTFYFREEGKMRQQRFIFFCKTSVEKAISRERINRL